MIYIRTIHFSVEPKKKKGYFNEHLNPFLVGTRLCKNEKHN